MIALCPWTNNVTGVVAVLVSKINSLLDMVNLTL